MDDQRALTQEERDRIAIIRSDRKARGVRRATVKLEDGVLRVELDEPSAHAMSALKPLRDTPACDATRIIGWEIRGTPEMRDQAIALLTAAGVAVGPRPLVACPFCKCEHVQPYPECVALHGAEDFLLDLASRLTPSASRRLRDAYERGIPGGGTLVSFCNYCGGERDPSIEATEAWEGYHHAADCDAAMYLTPSHTAGKST